MPMISVIVPVYNIRDYIEECVRSVLGQTETDWELLLVNDGSTDGSGELCRALAEKDRRIRVINRPNGGVAAARSTGLDAAAGEYVTFVDGDDTIFPRHLSILLELARRYGADAAASGMRLSGAEDREVVLADGVYTDRKAILETYLLASGGIYGCCNKLFRREVVGDIRFADYAYAEDALFCVRVLARCGVYAVSSEVGYNYRRHADSATTARPGPRSVDQIRSWTDIYELMREQAPEACPFVADKICHDIDRIYMSRRADGGEDRALLKAARLRFWPLRIGGGKLSVRRLAAKTVYALSPALYYRVAGAADRKKEGTPWKR